MNQVSSEDNRRKGGKVHLSPLARAFELNKNPNGGVAQLGEHLPCKQGVKSSNLSISTSVQILNRLYQHVP